MSNQVTMAQQLLEEIEIIGSEDLDLSALLDSLACAGLKLSIDKTGEASRAWVKFTMGYSNE